MKHFIITIDTEGDNLWSYHDGDKVETENTLAIPRFQDFCETFEFKPVYLTNYEMICDDRFVEYIKPKVEAGLCEVGIHVHAWNNPPLFQLKRKYSGNPYLIEYPTEVMRDKFAETYYLIKDRIGKVPVTHRAGRWVMNEAYFRLLKEFDVKVDCSFTPNVSWANSPGQTMEGGNDYTQVNREAHIVDGVLEVPMTIRKIRRKKEGSLKSRVKTLIKGEIVWLRPALASLNCMKNLCSRVDKEKNIDYLEFMLHSSELMVGGSPYFKTNHDIDNLYLIMGQLFDFVSKLGYKGITLADYEKEHGKNGSK